MFHTLSGSVRFLFGKLDTGVDTSGINDWFPTISLLMYLYTYVFIVQLMVFFVGYYSCIIQYLLLLNELI